MFGAGRAHRETLAYARWLLAVTVVVIAAGSLVLRLDRALTGLSATADAQEARAAQGVPPDLVSADLLDIDDDFVRQAEQLLPRDARYAVLLPADTAAAQTTYGVSPVTVQGLPDLMRELLLPRRDVDPGEHVTPRVPIGGWVLCYDCDTAPWDHRTQWRWNSNQGIAIGRVYR